MSKRVIIITSGETERRAIPHLLAHLKGEGISVDEVRYPPGNKSLSVDVVEKLVKAAWFANRNKPDKFVILVDIDGKVPDEVLRPYRENLQARVGENVTAAFQFAFAQWHLEAWFFADIGHLRDYLGRDPGSVDPSTPDTIQNPKQHLKQLLGDRMYTAVVCEEIASRLNASVIAARSPSFQGLLDAVRNGRSEVALEQ
jgi:hypothetical protein